MINSNKEGLLLMIISQCHQYLTSPVINCSPSNNQLPTTIHLSYSPSPNLRTSIPSLAPYTHTSHSSILAQTIHCIPDDSHPTSRLMAFISTPTYERPHLMPFKISPFFYFNYICLLNHS